MIENDEWMDACEEKKKSTTVYVAIVSVVPDHGNNFVFLFSRDGASILLFLSNM